MHDLKRLRFVTERYPHLQGLRLVPLGIPFLLSALWRNGQLPSVPGTAGHGAGYWFVGLIVIALVASSLVGRYYSRHFGSVEPERAKSDLLAAVGFLAIFFAAVWTQDQLASGPSIPALVIAIALGYVGVSGGGFRAHYLAVAILTLLFATLGPLGVPMQIREVLLDHLIGFGVIFVGIGDHLLLRGTLQPVPHV
jgi:hypothetical protein